MTQQLTPDRALRVAALIWAGLATPVAAQDSAQQVLDCAAANSPTRTFAQGLAFSTTGPGGGSRRIEAAVRGQRDEDRLKLHFRVEGPADLSGTAVLIIEKSGQDQMYLYLPSLRRTRKITGQMAGQKLFGTDFSYLDIKQLFGAFVDGAAMGLGDGQVGARPTHRIEITPARDEQAPFARLHADIDRETCVALKVEFHDEDGAVSKSLEADLASLTRIDAQRHLVRRYRLRDLGHGTETTVELGDTTFDEKLSRTLFNPKLFQDAR